MAASDEELRQDIDPFKQMIIIKIYQIDFSHSFS
jgi:hypothetical protein